MNTYVTNYCMPSSDEMVIDIVKYTVRKLVHSSTVSVGLSTALFLYCSLYRTVQIWILQVTVINRTSADHKSSALLLGDSGNYRVYGDMLLMRYKVR